MCEVEDIISSRIEVPDTTGRNRLEDTTTYKIGGRTFIVEPRFRESGAETIGAILLKLMRSDGTKK